MKKNFAPARKSEVQSVPPGDVGRVRYPSPAASLSLFTASSVSLLPSHFTWSADFSHTDSRRAGSLHVQHHSFARSLVSAPPFACQGAMDPRVPLSPFRYASRRRALRISYFPARADKWRKGRSPSMMPLMSRERK
jgi:hypothetical protein